MKLWQKFQQRRRERRVMRKCGCICWCPGCGDILNDQAKCWDRGTGVTYICSQCNVESLWNFDIAPVPLLIRHDAPQS